ncbi:DinB family protein [compost metagenome]
MYGELWEKGKILRVLISHQSHHRGQMTVIMRILGLPVPGLYGPSKEEWAEFGMIAPD